MEFSIARPDVVRAINQRWLFKFWKRHLGAHSVPPWQAVEVENLSRVSADLSFLDVIGDEGHARFQIRFHGETVGKVYGSVDCRGRFLDEVIPPAHQKGGLAPYYRTLESRCPVYTICEVTDRSGRLIHFERLLLPFSNNGGAIDRIVASFEFFCEDGAFDGHGLMTWQTAPPILRLSATIEAPELH